MNATEQPLSATLRAIPRPVWILFLGTFLNKFGTFVIPFLTLYLTGRCGFTTTQAAIALGAYGAGHFVAAGLGGYLADKIGRRKTIVLSMFCAAVTMLLLSQARTFFSVVSLTMLTGLASELYRPAGSALLVDLVPAGQRVAAFAAYRLAFNAGWAFGPATAGFLAERSFFWLFVGDAVTSLLFGLVAWFALPHGVKAKSQESGWPDALRVIAKDRQFHQVLLASILVAFVFFQISSTFGLYMTAKGISSTAYGLILSLNGLVVVICELPLTTFSQRFAARKVMALGYALVGLGFAANAFAETVTAFMLTMLVFTIGEMASMPVAGAYIADLAPEHMRGRYMGVNGFTWALALVFGPSLGMLLYRQSGTLLWLTCGLFGLLAAAIMLRSNKPKESLGAVQVYEASNS